MPSKYSRMKMLCLAVMLCSSYAMATDNPPIPVDTLPRFATPHFNFVTVVVSDANRALAFYTQALGMKERGRAQPDMKFFEIVVGFDDAPLTTGISLTYRGGVANPAGNGSSSINLVVKDLASIMAKVNAAGGQIVDGIQRIASAKVDYSMAHIKDPDGNAIELIEYHRIGK